jgi:hypothetical protein
MSANSTKGEREDKAVITKNRNDLENTLAKDFEWVLKVADTWKGLIEHPLCVDY